MIKYFLLLSLLILASCGHDQGNQAPAPGCFPVAKADSGGDVYFSPDPAQSKVSRIGMPDQDGVSCEWFPEQGLSDANSCHPFVSAPEATVLYTLTAKSKCNVSVSHMRAVMLKQGQRPEKPTVELRDSKGVLRTYFTGFVDDPLRNIRRPYRRFGMWEGKLAGAPLPREFDVEKACGPLWVGSQQCGDCWLWATQGTIEDHIQCRDQKTVSVARQEGIDCSGGGSCGGGNLVYGHYVQKGVPHTEDYGQYLGHNSSCKKDFTNFKEKIKSTYEVKYSKVGDLMRALVEIQASIGVCGASRALSNTGGWQESAINASEDHCYVLVGFVHGEDYGHKSGVYGKFKNSWGRSFGKNGFVYVWLGADENDKVHGTVIMEAETIEYKPACPVPKADAGPDRTLKLIVGLPNAVQLGTPGESGVVYSWSPVSSLDDARKAQPYATPMKTTTYTLSAKNACGEVKDDVLVTVYHE